MTVTMTRRELVDEAASNVGELAAGATLSDEDLDTIDKMVDSLFEQLSVDEILTVQDEDEIPASQFPFLGQLLANLVGPKFGIPFSKVVKDANEAILRRLVRSGPTREPLSVDFF